MKRTDVCIRKGTLLLRKRATYATKYINKSKASFVKIIVCTMNNFKYELESVFKKAFILTN